jgi:PAS domain-containing protein
VCCRWRHRRGRRRGQRDADEERGIIQDITERKRTEDTLRESEQRYQALIETNVDLSWEMDPHGRYTTAAPG